MVSKSRNQARQGDVLNLMQRKHITTTLLQDSSGETKYAQIVLRHIYMMCQIRNVHFKGAISAYIQTTVYCINRLL